MQPPVGGLATGPRGRGCHVPAAPHHRSWPIRGAVVPGGFDQQPSGVPVTGLGHCSLSSAGAGGVFRGHQAQVGADRAASQPMPVSVASPNALSVAIPRIQPSRRTTGVNSLSAAIASIAISNRCRRSMHAVMASKAAS